MAKETKKTEAEVTETEVVSDQETQEVLEVNGKSVVGDTESDEVLFLRRILEIQHTGGWGRHLDEVINERIKQLTE